MAGARSSRASASSGSTPSLRAASSASSRSTSLNPRPSASARETRRPPAPYWREMATTLMAAPRTRRAAWAFSGAARSLSGRGERPAELERLLEHELGVVVERGHMVGVGQRDELLALGAGPLVDAPRVRRFHRVVLR